jgi:hypothetical protein
VDTNSAGLVDEITLDFSRACLELAEARSRRRENDTPDRRATVAACQARIDSLLDMYSETEHPSYQEKSGCHS